MKDWGKVFHLNTFINSKVKTIEIVHGLIWHFLLNAFYSEPVLDFFYYLYHKDLQTDHKIRSKNKKLIYICLSSMFERF